MFARREGFSRNSHHAMSSTEGGICLGPGAANASSPHSNGDSVPDSSASPKSPWTSGDEHGGRGTESSELEIYVYSPKSVDEDDGDVVNPLPCSNTLSAASDLDESYSNDAEGTGSIIVAHAQDNRKDEEPSMLNRNGPNLSSTSIEGTQDEDPLPRPKIDGEDSRDDDENEDADGPRLDSPKVPISKVRSFNSASTDQIANRGSLPASLDSNCESVPSLSPSSSGADQRLKARVSTSPVASSQLRSSPVAQMRKDQCTGSPADEKAALNPTWDSLGDFGEPNDDERSPNTSPSKLRKSPEQDELIARSPSDNCDSPESRPGSQRPTIDSSREASASYSSPASTAAATVGDVVGESAVRDRPIPVRCGVNGQKRLGFSPEKMHVSATGLSENPSPALSSSDLRKKHRKQRKIEKQLCRTVKANGKHKDPEALARLNQNISEPAWEYNAKPSKEQSY